MKKIKDLVKTDTGKNDKKIYSNWGAIFQRDDDSMSVCIKTINGDVWLNCYDPKPRETSNDNTNLQEIKAEEEKQEDDWVDQSIPF